MGCGGNRGMNKSKKKLRLRRWKDRYKGKRPFLYLTLLHWYFMPPTLFGKRWHWLNCLAGIRGIEFRIGKCCIMLERW